MNKIQLDRLKEMVKNVAPFIPTHRFDMTDYGSFHGPIHDRGTSACMAGWAAVHPAFNKQGFRYIFGGPEFFGGNANPDGNPNADGYGDEYDFFGINQREWAHIFSSENISDPAIVACCALDVIAYWEDALK